MYIIKTDSLLKTGEYLNLELKGENLYFLKENKEISKAKVKDREIFRGRKLKGVIKESIGKDKYKVQIVRFADLHRHSEYSLLDGGSRITDLAEMTEYVGALTDHGNMFGFLKYYKAMKSAGKQPILGFEAYTETIEGEKKGNHLVLLAKNEAGYKNIVKLTSLAYHNFYKRPHISLEMLKERSEGVVCLSGCIGGEIPKKILEDYEGAKKVAITYRDIFADDFYIEIQNHNMGEEESRINEKLIKLANELNIKLVATTDSHYPKVKDKRYHDMLLALSTGKTLRSKDRMTFSGNGYHIHSADDMDERFAFIPEAIDNTLEIAEKCAGFELETGETFFPKFDIPKGFTEDSYFEHLVYEGFKERFEGNEEILNDKVYHDRLKREIGTIKDMGYPAYFLIVWDFIKFAKDNGIMVGPGRGSAAGSLVSYCLHITDLDPIPYGLLFERFLNPERVSLPDIDVDFCYERRGEVIEYVKEKYGKEAVSGIATFGTFAARSAVRDVTRVQEHSYSLGDRIAKAIPPTPGMTIKKALKESPELAKMYEEDDIAKMIIDSALEVEGLPRHSSVHACGIVIADKPVSEYMPEFMAGTEKEGKEITTQVTMSEVEELGLLKFDFLGLKTMSIIGRSIEAINKTSKEKINYLDIPVNDPYIYKYISKGKTEGVFQLESVGMRSFMKELYSDVPYLIRRIENKYELTGFTEIKGKGKEKKKYKEEMTKLGQELFERLIAGVSLYRPGPLDYIPNYLEGIRNPDEISYLTPKLRPILDATYGTIVYQEQVMQIVQSLAGYSLGRADIIRRAMGKKKIEIMEEEKEYFINGKLNEDGSIDVPGCVRNGINEEIAGEIWEQMADFSKYAFNKSHAAVYAMLGAITGWLKLYYPSIFMAETMNIFNSDANKLKMYLHVTGNMGIKILPPDLNTSNKEFSSNGKDVLFGLNAIKYMGQNADFIIDERNQRGEFEDIASFVDRMISYSQVNKRAIEGLVYSGALDKFPGTRRAKLEAIPVLVDSKKKSLKNVMSNQVNLWETEFAVENNYKIPSLNEFHEGYKLKKEKEFAGFYVTKHPLDMFLPYIKQNNITPIVDLLEYEEVSEEANIESLDGRYVDLVGIISDIKTFYTKKDNKPLKVFQVEDKGGSVKCVMFSNDIDNFGHFIIEDNIVALSGAVKEDDFGRQVIVDSIKKVEEVKEKKKVLHVKAFNEEQIKKLNSEILNVNKYKGNDPIYLTYQGKTLKSQKKINTKLVSIGVIRNIFSDENYEIKEIVI